MDANGLHPWAERSIEIARRDKVMGVGLRLFLNELTNDIFFSAKYCLRVARRMSLTIFSPRLCLVPDFCLISTSWWLRWTRNPLLSNHLQLSHWC